MPIPFGHLHLTIQERERKRARARALSATFDVASTCIELWNRVVYYTRRTADLSYGCGPGPAGAARGAASSLAAPLELAISAAVANEH